jgi:hypothetical protein
MGLAPVLLDDAMKAIIAAIMEHGARQELRNAGVVVVLFECVCVCVRGCVWAWVGVTGRKSAPSRLR